MKALRTRIVVVVLEARLSVRNVIVDADAAVIFQLDRTDCIRIDVVAGVFVHIYVRICSNAVSAEWFIVLLYSGGYY